MENKSNHFIILDNFSVLFYVALLLNVKIDFVSPILSQGEKAIYFQGQGLITRTVHIFIVQKKL